MRSKFWHKGGVVAVLWLLKYGLVWSQPAGLSFLKIDPSPRSDSLGGPGVVMSQGSEALSSNPANLGVTERKYELFTSFSNVIDNAQYGHMALSLNRSTRINRLIDGIGIFVTRLSVSDMEARDKSGQATGASYGSQDTAVGFSLSSNINRRSRIGWTGKAIKSEIAGHQSQTVLASDVGFSADFPGGGLPVTIGIATHNLGGAVRLMNQSDPLPASVESGIEVGIGPMNALLGASRMLHEDTTQVGMGFEFNMSVLSFRMGYRSPLASANRDGNSLDGLSAGVGIRLGSLKLDYAMSQQEKEFGVSHRAAITLEWGSHSIRK